MSSVQEYFTTLDQRFRPEAAQDVEAVFQWQLSGDGGCEMHAQVSKGDLTVTEGVHADPNVTLVVSASDYLKIVNGELNGTMAVMTRKMKVNGSIKMAKKMQQIFPLK